MRISDSFCGDQKSILHCSFNKNSKDCFERDFLFLLLLLLSLLQSRWLKRTWVTSNLIKAEKVESKYIHFERRKGGGFYNQHYFLQARCDKIRKAEHLFVMVSKMMLAAEKNTSFLQAWQTNIPTFLFRLWP